MTIGKEMTKMMANLTEDMVNGPTLYNILTMTLESPLVAAQMQQRISAVIGEIHFLHLSLFRKKNMEVILFYQT